MASREVRAAIVDMDKRFANSRSTPETLLAYAEDLEDLEAIDKDAVLQGIAECRRMYTFLPSVAQIRDQIADAIGERKGFWVTPETAWGEVEHTARSRGYKPMGTWANGKHHEPEPITWSSPIIERAVEAIGWRDICYSEGKDRTNLRAQFREAVKAEQARLKTDIVSGRFVTRGHALPTGSFSGKPRSMADIIGGMRAQLAPGQEATDATEQGQTRRKA